MAHRNLSCAHPASLGVLDAEEALAYSCNTYFANVASRMPAVALQRGLQRYGMHCTDALVEPEQRVLCALGLQGITVTPVQLTQAYARLAADLPSEGLRGSTVRAGLIGSVEYGMAHAAQTTGVELGGKTGTAHDAAPRFEHGWFAGVVFAAAQHLRPTHVMTVYTPGGNGNDAALAAHRYLQGRRWER